MNKILTIMVLFSFLFLNVCIASATNDNPSFLSGSGYYNKQHEIASKPATIMVPHKLITEGEMLIKRIHKDYKIHSAYSTPDIFGFKMVIWLPAAAWDNMDLKQKAAVEGYMASKFANWGVGIGRVSGQNILADKIVAHNQ